MEPSLLWGKVGQAGPREPAGWPRAPVAPEFPLGWAWPAPEAPAILPTILSPG